jgi:uncharacterized protein YkwD
LLGQTDGAQRASLRESGVPFATRSRSIVAAVVSAALLASLIAVPAAAATRATVRIPSQTVPQVTSAPATWYADEIFILHLTNCTRTGGWVQADATCKGRNTGRYSRYVPPLWYAGGFSATVARPYARLMAEKNVCTHFYGGSPLDRMRAAGYSSIRNWGENIGCRTSSNVRAAVLASHLFFQSEKSTNGGHWRNIKNPDFHWIGIGIWKYGSRVRLVTDFCA